MRILSTTAIISVLGSAAFADGLTYGRYSLDYSTADFGDSTASNTIFEGEVEYEIGQVFLSASVFGRNSSNGSSYQGFEAAAGYQITPEVLVGAGVLRTEYKTRDGETYYEAFGQYVSDQVKVGVNVMNFPDHDFRYTRYFGEASVAPAITVGAILIQFSDSDGTGYYFTGDYNEGPIDARVFMWGNTESDYGLIGARGSYEFANRYRASATFAKPTGEFAADESYLSVGGGVEITDGVWFDAAYAKPQGNDAPEDVYALRALLTYEFGESARLDRRMYSALLDDSRNITGGASF